MNRGLPISHRTFVNPGAPSPWTILRPRAADRPVSLSEVLDRVLNKGAVVAGEVVISVAGVDLVYLGVNLVLTSVETARQSKTQPRSLDAAC
jgi:gas vesicle structural protein